MGPPASLDQALLTTGPGIETPHLTPDLVPPTQDKKKLLKKSHFGVPQFPRPWLRPGTAVTTLQGLRASCKAGRKGGKNQVSLGWGELIFFQFVVLPQL